MSSPFVAEIRMFAGNFAPTGWAMCDGQLMPISQNTALFSLLGTFYGGDGKSTFALPDMQGNAAIHQGQGPGLSEYFLGQQGGSQNVTLLTTEIPVHTHSLVGDEDDGTFKTPQSMLMAAGSAMYAAPPPNVNLSPFALSPTGGSLPHNNMMPYLTVLFIIAMQGIFPARG